MTGVFLTGFHPKSSVSTDRTVMHLSARLLVFILTIFIASEIPSVSISLHLRLPLFRFHGFE